jgi:hypothetical protein
MDNRHKHIEKLINTLVVPKSNKILKDGLAPEIVNVEVDTIRKPSSFMEDVESISIMIHYRNQGRNYASVTDISYPISCMIVTIIPYVITGEYRIVIINILKDNLDSSTFRFNNYDPVQSFNAYLKLLEYRV